MKHRTEQVYDDEIFPLVAQIIEIAKRDGIPLLISAGFIDQEGGAATCDTFLPEAREGLPGVVNRHALAFGVIRGHSGFDTAAGLVISRYHP